KNNSSLNLLLQVIGLKGPFQLYVYYIQDIATIFLFPLLMHLIPKHLVKWENSIHNQLITISNFEIQISNKYNTWLPNTCNSSHALSQLAFFYTRPYDIFIANSENVL
ncbi:hypothetical protein ACJX0J_015741, partial [Zea mays]